MGHIKLFPKLVARGAAAYLLPDQDASDYRIEAQEGTIVEV